MHATPAHGSPAHTAPLHPKEHVVCVPGWHAPPAQLPAVVATPFTQLAGAHAVSVVA